MLRRDGESTWKSYTLRMANLIPLDSEEEVDIDSIRSDFLREEVIYRAQVRQLADGPADSSLGG